MPAVHLQSIKPAVLCRLKAARIQVQIYAETLPPATQSHLSVPRREVHVRQHPDLHCFPCDHAEEAEDGHLQLCKDQGS